MEEGVELNNYIIIELKELRLKSFIYLFFKFEDLKLVL